MSARLHTCTKPRAVIGFLFLDGESAENIHIRLVNINGKAAISISPVRWLISRGNGNARKKGEAELSDQYSRDKPAATVNIDATKKD